MMIDVATVRRNRKKKEMCEQNLRVGCLVEEVVMDLPPVLKVGIHSEFKDIVLQC